MKKFLKIVLVLAILLGIVSCIGNAAEDDSDYYSDYDSDYDYEYEEDPWSEPLYDYESCSRWYAEMLSSYPAQGEGTYASGRLIFSTDDPTLVLDIEADRYYALPGDTYVLQFSSPEAAEAAQQTLAEDSAVNYVEADILFSGQDFYSWGAMDMGVDLFATGMSQYQTMTPTIAVVDSGVNYHEMIHNLQPGWDFIENNDLPRDATGHGTHVAGIISDMMGSFNHSIMPLRVLGANNKGYSCNIALAIRYAADHGADIINLSLGGEHSNCIEEAVNYAINKGCSVVAAAGNDARDVHYMCPAHISGLVTVSSVDSEYNLARTSNFGNGVDVCAPGVGVLSACHTGGTVEMSGTSMAAPHISAILALIRASGIAQTAYEAESILYASCIDLGEEGRDFQFGWGIPDMNRIGQLVIEENTPDDYWILAMNADTAYEVGKVEFYEDGTYTITDTATGGVSTGTYYGLGDEQLTFYEDTPSYFLGRDFFYNKGYRYETDTSYLQDDGSYCVYTLTHCSGEHPYPDTAPAASEAPSSNSNTALGDGTYLVEFYLDSIYTSGDDATLDADFLGIIELSDSEVRSLTPGAYYGNGYSLNVEYVSFTDIDGVSYVDINDWEYGEYIPSRGVWRFKTVDDQPLTYFISTGEIFIPGSCTVWDYLTPFIFGQNAIGMQQGDYMSSDDPFYRTATIADFCDWHSTMSPYMQSEKAYVTLQNNTITQMIIPAHP